MTFSIPEAIAHKFVGRVPARKRSQYLTEALEPRAVRVPHLSPSPPNCDPPTADLQYLQVAPSLYHASMRYQYKREPLTADEATRLANACNPHEEKLVV